MEVDWVMIGTLATVAAMLTPIVIILVSTARKNGRLDHRVETLEAGMLVNETEHKEIKDLAYKTDRIVSKLEDLPENVSKLSDKMDQMLLLIGKGKQGGR